jgi:hypothetical protein
LAVSVSYELDDKITKVLMTRFLAAMLATVDDDGFPRIAPVSLFSVRDSKTILTMMQADCRSARNIRRDGKMMLNLCEEGDLAVGIRGKAAMLGDSKAFRGGAIFLVEVLEVKNDAAFDVEVTSGVRMKLRDLKWEKLINAAAAELDAAAGVEKQARIL